MIYNKRKFKKEISYYLKKDLMWNWEAFIEDAYWKACEHGEGSHDFEISSRCTKSGRVELMRFDVKWSEHSNCYHLYF